MELDKSPPPPSRNTVLSAFVDNIFLLFGLTFIAWCLESVDWFTGELLNLDRFGISPRDSSTLTGILTCHWLHAGFPHLLSNTPPFIMLGGFVLIGGRAMFWKVTFFVALAGGLTLWILGGKGNHIGASLVIFGYLGFLLARGVFERSALWIVISLVTLFLYGGMITGVLPGQSGVSWQGHLFGFLAGIGAARLLVEKNRTVYHFDRTLQS